MSFNDRGSHCTPLFSLAFIELLIYDTQQRFYCCVRVSDIEAEKTLMPYLIQRITIKFNLQAREKMDETH